MRAVVKVLPTEGHHTNLSNEPNFYVEVEVGCQKCSQVFRNFFDSLLDFPPGFPPKLFANLLPRPSSNESRVFCAGHQSFRAKSVNTHFGWYCLNNFQKSIATKYKVNTQLPPFRAFESLFCSPLYFKWILCWSSIFDSLVSQHLVHWCTMSLCYLGAETSQKLEYR